MARISKKRSAEIAQLARDYTRHSSERELTSAAQLPALADKWLAQALRYTQIEQSESDAFVIAFYRAASEIAANIAALAPGRARVIEAIACHFVTQLPASVLLHSTDVSRHAEQSLGDASSSTVLVRGMEYDRIEEHERDAFLVAFYRAAGEHAAGVIARKLETEQARIDLERAQKQNAA